MTSWVWQLELATTRSFLPLELFSTVWVVRTCGQVVQPDRPHRVNPLGGRAGSSCECTNL